jgi:methanogenic corrinoid protein MtbC1
VAEDDLYRRYLLALLHRDRVAAVGILLEEGVGKGVPVTDLYLQVIAPAQYQIGRLWQKNQLSVLEEHSATAISQLGMSLLYACIIRGEPIDKLAVIACVAGEEHDLGSRMVADMYEMAGFSVRYLGANVGVERLAAVVRESRPDVIGLSITMDANAEALLRTVARLRKITGNRSVLAVGGPAVSSSPELVTAIGADVSDPDAERAIRHSVSLVQHPADLTWSAPVDSDLGGGVRGDPAEG